MTSPAEDSHLAGRARCLTVAVTIYFTYTGKSFAEAARLAEERISPMLPSRDGVSNLRTGEIKAIDIADDGI